MSFQSFEDPAGQGNHAARLADLRNRMRDMDLDAFIVPRADAHQGEYVADADARLAWLTGFTGSAGFAIVTQDRAGVFIDGRYRVQVRQQIDPGDAAEDIHTNQLLLIARDSIDEAIGGLSLEPAIITPNGDGSNDQTLIRWICVPTHDYAQHRSASPV